MLAMRIQVRGSGPASLQKGNPAVGPFGLDLRVVDGRTQGLPGRWGLVWSRVEQDPRWGCEEAADWEPQENQGGTVAAHE